MPAPKQSANAVDDQALGLSLTDVAEQLGVHYMTAYRYIRLGLLNAKKVGGEWRIDPVDLARYVADPSVGKKPRLEANTDVEIDIESARRDLTEALIAGDEAQAWRAVHSVLDGSTDPSVFHTELLGPAMVDIGESWAEGRLSIAAEHRATAVARRLIGRSRPWFRGPGRRRGLVIIGAPESDHHALPTAIFADLVRAQGPNVIDLGAQTPASTFARALEGPTGDPIVSIVVTNPLALDDAASIVEAVKAVRPETEVLVGGFGVPDQETATRIGATHWCASSAEAATLVTSLVQPAR